MEKNRYLLTMIVAKRAKQLMAGAKPLIKTKHKNPIAIAIEEMERRKIYLKEPSGSKNPLERILNLDYSTLEEGKLGGIFKK